MNVILFFVALFFGHWLADFVFQSHRMASLKSRDFLVLCEHVGLYSLIMTLVVFDATSFTMGTKWPSLASLMWFFVGVFFLHLATDFVTSRMTSRRWEAAAWHEFFEVIGFDQWLHQVQLLVLAQVCFHVVS